jgi:hypothetical protein
MENNTPFREGDLVYHIDYSDEQMRVQRVVGEYVICKTKNSKGDWVEEPFHYKMLVLV